MLSLADQAKMVRCEKTVQFCYSESYHHTKADDVGLDIII